MSDTFKVKCQSVRADNGHFSMFFSHEQGLPSILVWLPKIYAPYREGMTYRVTIEPAQVNGS